MLQILVCIRLSQELYLKGWKIEDDPYTYLLVNSYLYRIAYLMVRYFRADTLEDGSKTSGTNYHIQQAVNYIEKHFKEDISAADTAAMVGLSREHFSRIFREYTGVTFKQFLISLRLAVAYRLLVGTELSTMDIALSAGFPDSQNFSRHFKRRYGCPPAEYRKTYARPSARK